MPAYYSRFNNYSCFDKMTLFVLSHRRSCDWPAPAAGNGTGSPLGDPGPLRGPFY